MRFFTQAGRLSAVGLIGALLASADPMNFSVITTAYLNSASPGGLSFTPASSSGVSAPNGSLILGNLGTFTVAKPSSDADVYDSNILTLDLAFSRPGGVDGEGIFPATVLGTVDALQGRLTIDFGPARHFTFSNAEGSGSFDVAINNVVLNVARWDSGPAAQTLTGKITNATDPPATVPEPLSMALLGTVGLFVTTRMRRQQQAAVPKYSH